MRVKRADRAHGNPRTTDANASATRAVGIPDDARQDLARFAEGARDALLADGWELGREGPATGDSSFLGSFQQSVAPDFVAIVQFVVESGPIIEGMELRPVQGAVRTRRVSAFVGGELGVRHLPTERLLAARQVPCEADVSLDLAEVFEAQGDELPLLTDEASADVASRVLADAVSTHALAFAHEHADVDRIVQFVSEGGQRTRDETFEHIFVPTLLAASGRSAEAHAALSDYQKRVTPGSDEEKEYFRFRDGLSGWLR